MFDAKTTVSVDGTRFAINGQLTYLGCGPAEGLLFNIRTVNATFDEPLVRAHAAPDPEQRTARGGVF
ncbi:MAG: hypothetical protein JXA09_16260 [Anaerolineae bacterium]|nr:hypothetical protein [Anaerolineae bacterium]